MSKTTFFIAILATFTCLAVCYTVNQTDRYMIIGSSTEYALAYKLDKNTGKVWFVEGPEQALSQEVKAKP